MVDSADRNARSARAYYQLFAITLVLCWSPLTLVAYMTPWIALAWYLVATRRQFALHNTLLILALWALCIPIYALLTPSFSITSALLTLLTYGPAIFVLAIPAKAVASHDLTTNMLSLARKVVLVQGIWGICQGVAAAVRQGTFDGATGDAVAGTIRPFLLEPDFSNPMFAVNIALMVIVLLPSLLRERKGGWAIGIGVLSLIMASVMHVLIFFVLALAMSLVIYYPSFLKTRRGCFFVLTSSLAGALAVVLLSHNFSTLVGFVANTVGGNTPRSKVVMRTILNAPTQYPWMPLIGLGPGQYTSRAALIGTGMYFGSPINPRPIPLLPTSMSEPFEKYVLDLWLSLFFDSQGNIVFRMNNTSSTYKPYFSWLSLYGEFGIVGVVATVVLSTRMLTRARKAVLPTSQRFVDASIGAGVVFLLLLGLQENYWEISQAVFVGMLMLKALYGNLVYTPDTRLRAETQRRNREAHCPSLPRNRVVAQDPYYNPSAG